jgi:hypothetical protein
VVNVRSNSADPDVFKGTFYPAAGGREAAGGYYEVNASFSQGGKVVANQGTVFVVHRSGQELADTRTDPQVLKTLSENTQPMGAYREVARAADLAQLIRPQNEPLPARDGVNLWDTPYLFLVFIGAVSCEWFIRRRNHLI